MPANQLTRQQRANLATLLQDRFLTDEDANTVADFLDKLNANGFALISDRRRLPMFQELSPMEIGKIAEALSTASGIPTDERYARNLITQLEDRGLGVIRLVREQSRKELPPSALALQPMLDRLIVKGDSMRFRSFKYDVTGIRVEYARHKGDDALYFKSVGMFETWLNSLSRVETKPGKPPENPPQPLAPLREGERPTSRPQRDRVPDMLGEAIVYYTATRVDRQEIIGFTPQQNRIAEYPDTRFLNRQQRQSAMIHLISLNLRCLPANYEALSPGDVDRWIKQRAEIRGWSSMMAADLPLHVPLTPEQRQSCIEFLNSIDALTAMRHTGFLYQWQIDAVLLHRASQHGWTQAWRPRYMLPAQPLPAPANTEEELQNNVLLREQTDAEDLWRASGRLGHCPAPVGFDGWGQYWDVRCNNYRTAATPENCSYHAPVLTEDGHIATTPIPAPISAPRARNAYTNVSIDRIVTRAQQRLYDEQIEQRVRASRLATHDVLTQTTATAMWSGGFDVATPPPAPTSAAFPEATPISDEPLDGRDE